VSQIKKTTFVTCHFTGEHLATASLQIGERADIDDHPRLPRIAWIAMRWKGGRGLKMLQHFKGWLTKSLFEQANAQ
jgi:hypothetical protein